MSEPTTRQRAWALFDGVIEQATREATYGIPWVREAGGGIRYEPDYATLERLLAIPLMLEAPTQSGVPALALDVWVAHELRRSGFDPDAVWPRASAPRIVPNSISRLLRGVRADLREQLVDKLATSAPPGTTGASANILGKHYVKQVDVVMSDWHTGPEVLISTKRMDSAFGKNVANRVEESYGDAKNLRSRHPMAALGFVYGLRTTIFDKEAAKAHWLMDLLEKLGREDDAYDATCLVLMEYADGAIGQLPETVEAPSDPESIPRVMIRLDLTPDSLQPARFLAEIVEHVLRVTPVTYHEAARRIRSAPRG